MLEETKRFPELDVRHRSEDDGSSRQIHHSPADTISFGKHDSTACSNCLSVCHPPQAVCTLSLAQLELVILSEETLQPQG